MSKKKDFYVFVLFPFLNFLKSRQNIVQLPTHLNLDRLNVFNIYLTLLINFMHFEINQCLKER